MMVTREAIANSTPPSSLAGSWRTGTRTQHREMAPRHRAKTRSGYISAITALGVFSPKPCALSWKTRFGSMSIASNWVDLALTKWLGETLNKHHRCSFSIPNFPWLVCTEPWASEAGVPCPLLLKFVFQTQLPSEGRRCRPLALR